MMAIASSRLTSVQPPVLGSAYCNLVVACTSAGDWERAREWCDLVDGFARSHDAAPLLGACRTIHADMLMATGRWPEAERALQSALEVHARYVPEMDAPTVAALAALRIQQGRLADATRLLAGREEQPASLRALALLRIAEGEPRVAVALLERGLQATEGNALQATALLATLVDARLAAGQVGPAGTAAAQLGEIATDTGIRLVRARAELATARVVLAGPAPREAAEPARRALADFGALGMPLDVGEARLELADHSAWSRPSWRPRRSARPWPCSGSWARGGRRTPRRPCCASSAGLLGASGYHACPKQGSARARNPATSAYGSSSRWPAGWRWAPCCGSVRWPWWASDDRRAGRARPVHPATTAGAVATR